MVGALAALPLVLVFLGVTIRGASRVRSVVDLWKESLEVKGAASPVQQCRTSPVPPHHDTPSPTVYEVSRFQNDF